MRFLVSFLVPVFFAFFEASPALFSQESKIDFTWLNRSEEMLAGSITAKLIPQKASGVYELEFSVIWYDRNGIPIPESASQPLLYLSIYDLDMEPAGKLTCSSFAGGGLTEIIFSSSGRLILEAMSGYEGEIKLLCKFQYALSQEHIRKGELEKITLQSGKTAVFPFVVKQQSAGREIDLAQTTLSREHRGPMQTASYRVLLGQYNNYNSQFKDFQRRKVNEELGERIEQLRNEADPVARQGGLKEVMGISRLFLSDLDNLIAGFNSVRNPADTDSLPSDTIRSFTQRFNRLSDEIQALRSDYYQYSLIIQSLEPAEDELNGSTMADSIRQTARITYVSLFQKQYDSLSAIVRNLDNLREVVLPLVGNGAVRQADISVLDSLMVRHETVKTDFTRLRMVHQQSLMDYRSLIFGIKPIQEVETLHGKFTSLQLETENKFLETETLVGDSRNKALARKDFSSRWYFWGVIGLAGILVLFSILRFFQLKRFRYPQIASGDLSVESSIPAPGGGGLSGNGIFSETGIANDYFKSDFSKVLSDLVVARIHYSPSAVKSVYQMVHGAFMEKRAGAFGGYLFGNHYKLTIDGVQKYEIVVERASSSDLLRPNVPNSMEFRADLVDEMNEQVKQNKKSMLVGWFTSSTDSGLEMTEGMKKIHRTFFNEKWQIGILINPGSEELNSACFMRRKTGYFDPIPEPGTFFKWEDMYRYAMNPATQAMQKSQVQKPDSEYFPLVLNSNWCDSIVNQIRFDKSVLLEMQNAATLQASPQETFQVVGYLYGAADLETAVEIKEPAYQVLADRFIELTNQTSPREIPGFRLVGWFGQGKSDIFDFIGAALGYHEQFFKDPYQGACLLNSQTGELRIFSRKHNLEINNSAIETEEFDFNEILLGLV